MTGGASGIGLALAKRCLSAGSNVVVSDGNPELLLKASSELSKDTVGHGGGEECFGRSCRPPLHHLLNSITRQAMLMLLMRPGWTLAP